MTFSTILVKTLCVVMMFHNVVAVENSDIMSWFSDSYSTAVSTANGIMTMLHPNSASGDFEDQSEAQRLAAEVHLARKLKYNLEQIRYDPEELNIDPKVVRSVDGLAVNLYEYRSVKKNLRDTTDEYERFNRTVNLPPHAFTWTEQHIMVPLFKFIIAACDYIADCPMLYNLIWFLGQTYQHWFLVTLTFALCKKFANLSDWVKALIQVSVMLAIGFAFYHYCVFTEKAKDTEVYDSPVKAWDDCMNSMGSVDSCYKRAQDFKHLRAVRTLGLLKYDQSTTNFDLEQRITYGFIGGLAWSGLYTVVENNGSRMLIIEEDMRREMESKIHDMKVVMSKYQGQIDSYERALANSVSSAIITRGIPVPENILALSSSAHNASPTCD